MDDSSFADVSTNDISVGDISASDNSPSSKPHVTKVVVPTVVKSSKQAKENIKPTKMASIPRGARRTGENTSSKKRVKSESDSEDTPPPRNSKRVRSFNLQGFLEEERERREEFQGKMLLQIEKGNDQFAKSADNTKAFQTDFLTLLARALPPRD